MIRARRRLARAFGRFFFIFSFLAFICFWILASCRSPPYQRPRGDRDRWQIGNRLDCHHSANHEPARVFLPVALSFQSNDDTFGIKKAQI